MKRIARQSRHNPGSAEALQAHETLQRLLRRYLPPSTAATFARPKEAADEIIEWYSDLDGQPIPFAQLPQAEARQLQGRLEERLQAMRGLADQLQAQGSEGAEQARLLRAAAASPHPDNLYALNGQPLITFWGGAAEPAPAPLPPIAGASGLASVAGEAADSTTEPAREPRKRRWWPWLLLLLLLLALLAALWWWFFCREPQVPPVVEPVASEEPVLPTEEPAESPAVEPEPERPAEPEPEPVEPEPVAQPEPEPPPPPPPPPEPTPKELLQKRIAAAGNRCDTLQQLLRDEPLLKGSAPKEAQLRQQVQKTLDSHCKQQQIRNAKNLCPGERPKELAPELVIVFDASGSMDISMLASKEDIDRAMMTQGLTNLATQLLLGGNPGINTMGHVFREPKRLTVAKQATTAVVQQLPSDANAGLVLVEDCPRARSVGYFSPGERGRLLGNLQGIQARQGTPLADGIAKAGQMVDGVNKESVILVVSDGEESCGVDPCAIARELARSKPNLKINVVDILSTGAGNCLAAATGGRVFNANDVNQLSLVTRQAAQDVLPPAHCSP